MSEYVSYIKISRNCIQSIKNNKGLTSQDKTDAIAALTIIATEVDFNHGTLKLFKKQHTMSMFCMSAVRTNRAVAVLSKLDYLQIVQYRDGEQRRVGEPWIVIMNPRVSHRNMLDIISVNHTNTYDTCVKLYEKAKERGYADAELFNTTNRFYKPPEV